LEDDSQSHTGDESCASGGDHHRAHGDRVRSGGAQGMRASALVIGILLVAPNASAFSVAGELAARGWFMAATGTANGTDLAKLGFDDAKGAPEFRGELVLADRHHLGITYLRIRREESAVVSGTILGIIRFDDPVDLDVSVDDVRGHYGY